MATWRTSSRRLMPDSLREGSPSPAPGFFPHKKEHQSLFEAKGFFVTSMRLFPRPTPLPGDVGGWLETFAQAYTSMLAPAQRAAFVPEILDRLRPTLRYADGRWEASYVCGCGSARGSRPSSPRQNREQRAATHPTAALCSRQSSAVRNTADNCLVIQLNSN